MRIEDLRYARRPEVEWDGFMAALDARLKHERRRKAWSWAAAAAIFLAALVSFWFLPRTEGGRPSLRADVPTLSSPLFTPTTGDALAVASGTVLVIPEVHT